MQLHDASHAARQRSLRSLAELAALDEAGWFKYLDAEGQGDDVNSAWAIKLRYDVERFAAENNIDITRGSSGYWLLTFYDPGAEPGDAFLAATIIWGKDRNDAIELARTWDAHPGGEVNARQIPRRKVPGEDWRQRLLSAEELRELGDITNHYDA